MTERVYDPDLFEMNLNRIGDLYAAGYLSFEEFERELDAQFRSIVGATPIRPRRPLSDQAMDTHGEIR